MLNIGTVLSIAHAVSTDVVLSASMVLSTAIVLAVVWLPTGWCWASLGRRFFTGGALVVAQLVSKFRLVLLSR